MHSVHPTPKFSIITVTYNAEKVLEDTIQSVISQTYHHIEYIIVDGASKDGTISIINRYRPHIHTVVSEPDKGLYDAMNKGIALASGDYLCFLNAGDCFHEDDTLETIGDRFPEAFIHNRRQIRILLFVLALYFHLHLDLLYACGQLVDALCDQSIGFSLPEIVNGTAQLADTASCQFLGLRQIFSRTSARAPAFVIDTDQL